MMYLLYVQVGKPTFVVVSRGNFEKTYYSTGTVLNQFKI
jgi:hypothetical protein